MPDEKKMSMSEAVDQAMADTGSGEGESSESNEGAKSTEGEGEKSSESTGDESAKDSDKSGETNDTSKEGDDADSSDEDKSDSVQDVIDQRIKNALGQAKDGRSGKKTGDRSEAYRKVVDDIAATVVGTGAKKKEGPLDVGDIDVEDPKSVQGYVDSRIKHFINEALADKVDPIKEQMDLHAAEAELRKLAADHPDAHKYGKVMAKMIGDYPKISLEDAYRVASWEDQKKIGEQGAYKNMDKKKGANLQSTNKKAPSESNSKPVSARESVLKAMEETGATFDGA